MLVILWKRGKHRRLLARSLAYQDLLLSLSFWLFLCWLRVELLIYNICTFLSDWFTTNVATYTSTMWFGNLSAAEATRLQHHASIQLLLIIISLQIQTFHFHVFVSPCIDEFYKLRIIGAHGIVCIRHMSAIFVFWYTRCGNEPADKIDKVIEVRLVHFAATFIRCPIYHINFLLQRLVYDCESSVVR